MERGTGIDTVLEITDGKGKLRLDASLIVLATLSHPDDPDQRLKYSEVLSAKALIELEAPARVTRPQPLRPSD